MPPAERREETVNMVTDRRGCSVQELAAEPGVSETTIRRDLRELSEQSPVERTRSVVDRPLRPYHYQTLNVGDPDSLPTEEVDHLLDRFADYGQDH